MWKSGGPEWGRVLSLRAQLGNLELLVLQALPHPLGGHSCPHCDPKLLPTFILQGSTKGLVLSVSRGDRSRQAFSRTGLRFSVTGSGCSLVRHSCLLSGAPSCEGSGEGCFLQQFPRSDSWRSLPIATVGSAFISENLTPIEGREKWHGCHSARKYTESGRRHLDILVMPTSLHRGN